MAKDKRIDGNININIDTDNDLNKIEKEIEGIKKTSNPKARYWANKYISLRMDPVWKSAMDFLETFPKTLESSTAS